MARRRNDGLPPGAVVLPSGRVTLQISITEAGRKHRVSPQQIDPREDPSYPNDPAIVWEAYNRIQRFLAHKVERGHTVKGFWEKWTDPDHHRWGIASGRTGSSIRTNKSSTRKFVELHANEPLLGITEKTIDKFMEDEGGLYSHLVKLDLFFSDAMKAKLIVEHPCRELARKREIAERERRARTRPPVPSELQVETFLEYASRPEYPLDLSGWLTIGVEHGMRPGEIDYMEWEYQEGDLYSIRWQWNTNERPRAKTPPKDDSFRTLGLSDRALEIIARQRQRSSGSPFIFETNQGEHWYPQMRDYYWNDFRPAKGEPTLCELAGGMTVYNATRHYWATMALNKWGIPLRKAALMFGHKDGGVLMHKTYARQDEDAATDVQAALNARPISLDAERHRRRAA